MPTGDPLTGASNAGGVGINRDSELSIDDCWTCKQRRRTSRLYTLSYRRRRQGRIQNLGLGDNGRGTGDESPQAGSRGRAPVGLWERSLQKPEEYLRHEAGKTTYEKKNCLYSVWMKVILCLCFYVLSSLACLQYTYFHCVLNSFNFCRAMIKSSAALAVMRCPSVCLCVCVFVTFVHSVKTNKDIFNFFHRSVATPF